MKAQVSAEIGGVWHRATKIEKVGRKCRVRINGNGEIHCIPMNRVRERRPNRGKSSNGGFARGGS